MFDQTFVDQPQQTAKPYTMFASTLLQAAAIGVGVLIPLLVTQTLPSASLKSILMAPPPPTAPPVANTIAKSRPAASVRVFNSTHLIAPTVIPKKIASASEAQAAPDMSGIAVSEGAGAGNSMLFGPSGADHAPMPPPPAEPPKAAHKGPVRIGGQVAEANLIRRVDPTYPALAKAARVSGVVEFTAVIDKQGRVEKLQLVRGHPLLVNAAREAILQWRYRPTTLNGEPVDVVTSITVNFLLSQ